MIPPLSLAAAEAQEDERSTPDQGSEQAEPATEEREEPGESKVVLAPLLMRRLVGAGKWCFLAGSVLKSLSY